MERPPGWTAQRSMARGSLAARDLRPDSLRVRPISPGTHRIAAYRNPTRRWPCDEVTGGGDGNGEEAIDGKAGWLGTDQRRGTSIGEDEKREHLLEIVDFLKVERAELEIENEHLGAWARNERYGGRT